MADMLRRSIGIVLVIGLVSSGCVSRTPAKVGIGFGVGILTIGALLAAGAAGNGGETDPKHFAPPILVLGALVTVIGLVALASTVTTTPRTHAPAVLMVDPAAAARARAWELTKQAAAAARADDCATVATHDVTVKQLDADFHATVFLRDAAIARCLAPPPSP
jgi:hypothetical protein